MVKVNRRAELQVAITHIERVLDDLNVDFSECGQCGMKHYDNFTDWQCFTRLESIVQSLQKQINNNAMLPLSRDNEESDHDKKRQSSGR